MLGLDMNELEKEVINQMYSDSTVTDHKRARKVLWLNHGAVYRQCIGSPNMTT